MALRQIVQIGEPVLRKKSKKVEKIDEKLIQLLDDMAETMYEGEELLARAFCHEIDHLDGILFVDKIEK